MGIRMGVGVGVGVELGVHTSNDGGHMEMERVRASVNTALKDCSRRDVCPCPGASVKLSAQNRRV